MPRKLLCSVICLVLASCAFGQDAPSPDPIAATKSLLECRPGAPPEQMYDRFNAFCLAHFGAEKEPLVYELFGTELKVMEGGSWRHISATSACIAWETNLPAATNVEYGETTAYGSRTQTAERPFYIHVHYLKDLKPNATYHYRLVSVDERGNKAVSADAVFKTGRTEDVICLPGNLGEPPYKLDKPGAAYLLTSDLTASGNAIEVLADSITLDLGGHCVTFAEGAKAPTSGIYAHGTEKTKTKYQVTGLTLANGTVRQGVSPAMSGNKNSDAFNCLNIVGSDIRIAGVTLDYHAPQTWGGFISHAAGAIDIHHNVFLDRGSEITNRHGMGVRPFGFVKQKPGVNAFELHHNLVKRTRQNGMHGANRMYDNEVYVDSFSTNSFAMQPNSVPDTDAGEHHHNRIFTTGFNPYGFGWAHLNLKIHDNLVHMQGIGSKSRWVGVEDWGDIDMSAGMRVTNYGKGGQKRENLEYFRNLIVLKGRDGCEMRGTEFFSDETIKDLVFRDNTVKVEAEDDKTRRAACIDTHGLPEKADTVLPVFYRNCTLISNICHVRFGDSYGKGSNHRFVDCKFVRTGNDPRYHTFIFDGGFWSRRHEIVDCTFGEGTRYDDVWWEKTANTSSYAVKWTLTLKTAPGASVSIKNKDGEEEFSGSAAADGSLRIPLTQCLIRPREWNPSVKPNAGVCEVKLRGERQELPCTPHTVTVTKDGKTATRSVEMRSRQTLDVNF